MGRAGEGSGYIIAQNSPRPCPAVLQVLPIGRCYVILYRKSSATKKKTKTVGFIRAPDGIFSMDAVRVILAGRRSSALWSSDEEPTGKEASGYRPPLTVALTDTGGRTGDADEASGSQTQRASWEKGLVKIPEPAPPSDPHQSPFEFQKQRPFQCENGAAGLLVVGRCARI